MSGILLVIAVLSSGFTGYTEITETGIDGYIISGMVTEIEGEIIDQPIGEESVQIPESGTRSEILWVDRDHKAAIANKTVICRDGEGILVSWYLNNDRISRYDTDGSAIPVWSYSTPGNSWRMDVAAGQDTVVFAAASTVDGVFAWLTSSPAPSVILDPGRKVDTTVDGLFLVYVNASGDSLICVDTSTETEIWKVPLYAVGSETCGVDICGDGTLVLVSVYDSASGCQVYDMTDGSLVGNPVRNGNQYPAIMSDDGTRFVTGEYNGRIRFYEYNGTSWERVYSYTTGHTWATAAALSADGQTAAGGTMGTSPLRGKVVVFDWPAGEIPSMMWEYENYGDMVTSCDISDDGSVIVAGSWGRYQGTFGDVFTAFDRSGDVMLSILDDIDEPGSIFSVSISADGCYATASGKAVHARAMGNGGEVYSIDLTPEGIGGTPAIPPALGMGEPYPNPVTSLMSIEILIPRTGGSVDLAVYDLNGRRVATLDSESSPGRHVSAWNPVGDTGETLSAGLYFIRLTVPGTAVTRKVMIVN